MTPEQKRIYYGHLEREIYNDTGRDIYFSLSSDATKLRNEARLSLGEPFGIIKNGERKVLKHGFYIFKEKSGALFEGAPLSIFGNKIGTGMKKPSRPEVKRNQFFMGKR